MNLSHLDNFLWAAGFFGHVALLVVLLFRRHWRQFPAFTTWIGFNATLTVLLFAIYQKHAWPLYKHVYWSSAAIDIALQIAIVFEMARTVLRPTGTWVRDARAMFFTWGAAGAVVAMALSYAAVSSSGSALVVWEARGNLFTSMLTCELFFAMILASNRLGLVWRNHVMGLGQGLTLWALIALCKDVAQNFMGLHGSLSALEHVRQFAYLGALLYWTVTFWLPEPARQPLPDEMREYLVALHKRVQYDSDRLSSARKS